MSTQPDAFLTLAPNHNTLTKAVNTPKNSKIQPESFNLWTNNFMYQSTYSQFHSRVDEHPKNSVIPGYAGFVPSIKAESMYGRGYSALARQSLCDENIYKNMKGLFTAGTNLNSNKQLLIDKSKVATSSRYGKSSLQKAHPGWNDKWRTTTQESYKNPQSRVNPTYRQTPCRLQTQGPNTKSSGFMKNNSTFDEYGWKPHPNLIGDNRRTEYRDKFNAQHPFHRNVHICKPPLLKKQS